MKTRLLVLMFASSTFLLSACASSTTSSDSDLTQQGVVEDMDMPEADSIATFAGGCFWCMEPAFESLEGVSEVISGYAGGDEAHANYAEVSTGSTGHREAVQVSYDSSLIDYQTLLDTYWRQIDPTDSGGQFADRGFQYTTAIYYHDETQQKLALESLQLLTDSGKFEDSIATVILPYTTFFPAEEFHQDFYKKSSDYYEQYAQGSGRKGFIEENWAKEAALQFSREPGITCDTYKCFQKPSDEVLKVMLTELQYKVTQQNSTERAFDNAYWDHHEEGIYVDVVSGEPLFSSLDKFDSGTGWPSFTRPISEDYVTTRMDDELFYPRTEVRSKIADSHLGHVFSDAPEELGGERWCINSAALRFIPKDELSGPYATFATLF